MFPKYFQAPAKAIFRGENNKMANTTTIRIHQYKEWVEEVERDFAEGNFFLGSKRKN